MTLLVELKRDACKNKDKCDDEGLMPHVAIRLSQHESLLISHCHARYLAAITIAIYIRVESEAIDTEGTKPARRGRKSKV